jgi:Fe-S cluster assembly iron-binding protein IscA
MMDITSRALGELKRILTSNADYGYARLRIIPHGQESFGLGIDIEMPSDRVFDYEGSGLLVVDKALAASLDDIIIDIDETPKGSQIVFDKAC